MTPRFFALRCLFLAGSGYLWSCTRNLARILIGREPTISHDRLLLGQHAPELMGLRPIREITCPGLGSEGAASQALTIAYAIAFARRTGIAYIHSPFSSIAHADRPMPEWVAAWESFFNLGAGEVVYDRRRHKAVPFLELSDYCSRFKGVERCFGWRVSLEEFERDTLDAYIPELRRKYYLNKHKRQKAQVQVAVHVRRGDVSAERHTVYFTDTDTILRTVTEVKAILCSHGVPYKVGVYSEGRPDDFAELNLPGIEFFINADPIWTLSQLIEADVLIMAKGCYSYYAGLISDGIKMLETPSTDADSQPMAGWLLRASDGSFDRGAFERQLLSLLQARGTM